MKHRRTTTARGWQYKHRFNSIIRAFKIKNKYLFGEKRGKLNSDEKTKIFKVLSQKEKITKALSQKGFHFVYSYRFKIGFIPN